MVGREPVRSKVPDEVALREALGAQALAPGVLLIERRLGARLRHGRVVLKPDGAVVERLPSSLRVLMAPKVATQPPSAPLVYLDTETSGLSGGSGTWAFLTGIVSADGEGWRLRQYLLTRLDAEAEYLEAVRGAITGAGAMVSYNGRSFDVPLLTTRFRLCEQPDPFARLPHLDLLAPVRRAFGRVWPDCRLATAESRLLGLEREGDMPGSAAPLAWLDWLRRGDTTGLAAVLRHNRWDLFSLVGLVPVLGEAFEDPVSLGADTHAVAAHHIGHGQPDRALWMLRADRHRLGTAGLLELARLHRRRGEWGEACAIWETLAAAGEQAALAALAKYHEHRSRDLLRALGYAIALSPSPERDRRCERLEAKLALKRGA